MSQFQFPCPNCSQAVLCEDEYRGMDLICPHCNTQITAPAPAGQAGKLGMTAAHAPMPKPSGMAPPAKIPRKKRDFKWVKIAVGVVVACGAGAFLYAHPQYVKWAEVKVGLAKPEPLPETNAPPVVAEVETNPPPVVPVSPPAVWTLDLGARTLPNYKAKGSIAAAEFVVDAARVDNRSVLSLIQGTGPIPDREFIIYLLLQPGDSLEGQKFNVTPEEKTGVPPVLKRWRTDPNHGLLSRNFPNGYGMRLEFGLTNSGKLPGKIYLSVPDDEHSFVAGTFEADVRPPGAPNTLTRAPGPNQPPSGFRNGPNGPSVGNLRRRLPQPGTGGGNMIPNGVPVVPF